MPVCVLCSCWPLRGGSVLSMPFHFDHLVERTLGRRHSLSLSSLRSMPQVSSLSQIHISLFTLCQHLSEYVVDHCLNLGTIHIYFLSGSMCPVEVVVRTLAQVIGALAVFKYVQLLWTMEFAETHVGRSHRYACCQLLICLLIAIICIGIYCNL